MTPGAFFYGDCDGKFTDEDLNDEGNAFAQAYFDPQKERYLLDYDAVLCEGLQTAYQVRDTWQNFDKLKPRLDRRLAEWRAGKLGKKPWWKFWEPFVVLLVFLLVPLAADAQTYPSRPVKIVVAVPARRRQRFHRALRRRAPVAPRWDSSSWWRTARARAAPSARRLGLKAAADGYTLTLISNSYTANASLFPLRFDPVADMTPLIQISQGPYLVVVHPSRAGEDARRAAGAREEEPERLNFASSGQGSINHLAIALFALMGGFQLNHVPYKGTGPALTDTIGGQTNAMLGSPSSTLPHVRAGRLRLLAVTTAQRIAADPDAPTVAEAGCRATKSRSGTGSSARRACRRPIVERINGEVTRVLAAQGSREPAAERRRHARRRHRPNRSATPSAVRSRSGARWCATPASKPSKTQLRRGVDDHARSRRRGTASRRPD